MSTSQEPSSSNDVAIESASSSPPPSSPISERGSFISPTISRSGSFVGSSKDEDWEGAAQVDRLTLFDLLDNLALPSLALNQRIEKWNRTLQTQSETFKKQGKYVKETYDKQKERVFKKRDVELDKLRARYGKNVDQLMKRWQDQKTVTLREKISFVMGVSNIFISGYLLGGYPDMLHWWYTLQMVYFMPIRFYTYHKRGYHYFLADLCYFVNVLLLFSIWVFPNSRRLFISAYCLSYGNNAWAIAMWRNSLVFHSLDKITSLFIHLMPPVVLHSIVHQDAMQGQMFALERIRKEGGFSLLEMIGWASVPYLFWQACYHFFITVRRADKIAAGRPTSFTWLRKSYSKTYIGKIVLSLPESLQEVAFMGIQYGYAVLTMLPVPLWFNSRLLSAMFISIMGLWSVYNGATFYIDVFGKRFEKEMLALKRDIERTQRTQPPTPGHEQPVSPEYKSPTSNASTRDEAQDSKDAGLSTLEPLPPSAADPGLRQRVTSGITHDNPSS
ncbi:hypothetical protein Dda_3596 [Drechslerella dactyloides]|uniref:Glycerophosphocholine acyltransferase 1 n=1 Tax=Drechslerella dactyloides TaxID=74499 RepID=A0AAD6NK24_DREDA|nr:hypothetical protein Dda_3596 [Drechslerella dactyloides]